MIIFMYLKNRDKKATQLTVMTDLALINRNKP